MDNNKKEKFINFEFGVSFRLPKSADSYSDLLYEFKDWQLKLKSDGSTIVMLSEAFDITTYSVGEIMSLNMTTKDDLEFDENRFVDKSRSTETDPSIAAAVHLSNIVSLTLNELVVKIGEEILPISQLHVAHAAIYDKYGTKYDMLGNTVSSQSITVWRV